MLEAPLERGAVLGRMTLSLDDETMAERDLVALHSVEQGGFFKRIWDAIKLFFMNLFS